MNKALFINPPIYDFALFDLFLKPYGLLRVEKAFLTNKYQTEFLNCLDYKEPNSMEKLGEAKRKKNGTGKFFRDYIKNTMFADLPVIVYAQEQVKRRIFRYGILEEEIKKRIIQADPDLIFVTTGMTYWYLGVKEVIAIVKEVKPEVKIICGGVYATLMPEHCKNVCGADYVVQADDFNSLNNILGELNFPQLLGGFPEFPNFRKEVFDEAGVLRLNEGCPNRCEYCASSLISPKFVRGNPETNFEYFKKMYNSGIRSFAFYDDAILVNAKNVLIPFLKRVIADCGDVSFYTPNAMHIRLLDEEIIALMAEAGFKEIRLGFESYDSSFQDHYHRKYQFADFIKSMELLNKYGFRGSSLRLYTLAGLPRQTVDEVVRTINQAKGVDARISIAEFSPVPNTLLWEESLKYSKFPLAEEPLFHNNSFFPLQWEGFTLEDLQMVKSLSNTSYVK